jgi:DNA-binding IclR family transcriptional regulator
MTRPERPVPETVNPKQPRPAARRPRQAKSSGHRHSTTPQSRPATTADRVLSLMSLFTMEHPEWTVEAAAREINLPITTTYRYFRSLSRAGFIMALVTGRYVLGPAIMYYDRQMRLLDPLTTVARPFMRAVVATAPQPAAIVLCRLYRNQVICVHHELTGPVQFGYDRGALLTLYQGACSKMILANLAAHTARAHFEQHPNEFKRFGLGANWPAVRSRLQELRAAGFGWTRSELDDGLADIAVPMLFDARRQAVGALGMVLRTQDCTPEVIERAQQSLRLGSAQIIAAAAQAIQQERKTLGSESVLGASARPVSR